MMRMVSDHEDDNNDDDNDHYHDRGDHDNGISCYIS